MVFALITMNNCVDFDNITCFNSTIDNNLADVLQPVIDTVIDFVFLSEIVIYT
jgi:hypothetical protein